LLRCRLGRLLRIGLGRLLRIGLRGGGLLCGVRILLLREGLRGGERQDGKDGGERHDEREKAPDHGATLARKPRVDYPMVVVLVQLSALPTRYGG
jgi:hypothetical protein